MNHDSEKWLDDRISEDVDRMADKRIKELMESEELKDIEATMDQLQSIRKRLGLVDVEDEHDMEIAGELTPEVSAGSHVKPASEESTPSEAASKAEDAASDDEGNDVGKVVEIRATETSAASDHMKTACRPRIRLRAALAAALVAILALGVGMVGSGKKVYLPVVSQKENGDESTTIVDNDEENVYGGYEEEEICQEIEDKLGVLPIRLGYRPKDMALQEYWIKEDAKEAILKYTSGEKKLHIYISKDYDNSSINFKVDGESNEIIKMSAMRMEVPVYQYEDSDENSYYQVSFEYLNTYYSLSGLMNKEEFKQILENIWVKNV